ncbi:histone acetyltransferase [Geranomyces variabilis]|nr:histone acetyltransferase [Geranomyces variabilis]
MDGPGSSSDDSKPKPARRRFGWIEIVSATATPGPFTRAPTPPPLQQEAVIAETQSCTRKKRGRPPKPRNHDAASNGNASGRLRPGRRRGPKRKPVGHSARDPVDLASPPGLSLVDRVSSHAKRRRSDGPDHGAEDDDADVRNSASTKSQKRRRTAPSAATNETPTPAPTPAINFVHYPLFNNRAGAHSTPVTLVAMIQFIIFCHQFAKFTGWLPLPVSEMENELTDGKSPHVVSVITRLLSLVNSAPKPRLSNWEEVFRTQMALRNTAIVWPRDDDFAELDVSLRMQLLCDLSDWVLAAHKKKMCKPRPPPMLPVAIERVASQRKTFVYWHFPVGELSQRLYCHISDFDPAENEDKNDIHCPDTTGSDPSPQTDSVQAEIYHLVASTERSWASFLHKALSSRVPAHLDIRPAFEKLKKEMEKEDFETPVTGPRIPAEAVMHELEEAETAIIKEELEEAQEKERAHAAREAAHHAGVVSMSDIQSPRGPPFADSGFQPAVDDDNEVMKTLLALHRDLSASNVKNASGAEDHDASDVENSVESNIGEHWSSPAEMAAAQKEQDIRIRKAMAHQLWTLHRDVEQHAAAAEQAGLDASDTRPLWECLTNQLIEPSVPADMNPRLWIRNTRGVQYDPALLSRPMDHIVKNTCKHIVDSLKRHPSHEPFFEPVDLTSIPEYTTVVKQPMELKTIYVKILLNNYKSFHGFLEDMHLIFDNCKRFNKRTAEIVRQCLALELRFLEICCALGVAVGHDGTGIKKPDPFAMFDEKKKNSKRIPKTPKEKRTPKTPTILKTPTEKRPRGRPRKTPSTALGLFELNPVSPMATSETSAEKAFPSLVSESSREADPMPAGLSHCDSLSSPPSAQKSHQLEPYDPLPPPPPMSESPAEEFARYATAAGFGTYPTDDIHP